MDEKILIGIAIVIIVIIIVFVYMKTGDDDDDIDETEDDDKDTNEDEKDENIADDTNEDETEDITEDEDNADEDTTEVEKKTCMRLINSNGDTEKVTYTGERPDDCGEVVTCEGIPEGQEYVYELGDIHYLKHKGEPKRCKVETSMYLPKNANVATSLDDKIFYVSGTKAPVPNSCMGLHPDSEKGFEHEQVKLYYRGDNNKRCNENLGTCFDGDINVLYYDNKDKYCPTLNCLGIDGDIHEFQGPVPKICQGPATKMLMVNDDKEFVTISSSIFDYMDTGLTPTPADIIDGVLFVGPYIVVTTDNGLKVIAPNSYHTANFDNVTKWEYEKVDTTDTEYGPVDVVLIHKKNTDEYLAFGGLFSVRPLGSLNHSYEFLLGTEQQFSSFRRIINKPDRYSFIEEDPDELPTERDDDGAIDFIYD